MVASIINAVAAGQVAHEEADAMPWEVPHVCEPLDEQTRKRLEACLRFRQAVADDLHGIHQMERELTGGILPSGPYEKGAGR